MTIKSATKMKQTKQAQSNFKKWESAKEQTGYKAKRGEYFVPVNTKNKSGIGRKYVSNKGTVISFYNSKEPREIPQTKEKTGYKKVGVEVYNNWVDRVVWFSFRDCIKKQRTNSDKIAKRKTEVKEFLTQGLADKDIIIHHINRKQTDNRIENLIALPKCIKGVNLHNLLHDIQKHGLQETEKQFLKTAEQISKLGLQEPTMFLGGDDRIEPIVIKDKAEFMKQVNQVLNEYFRERRRQELQNYFKVEISDATLDNIIFIDEKLGSEKYFVECIDDSFKNDITQKIFDSLVNSLKVVVSKK